MQTIGYRMRLDTRVSRATRIEVVTEGVLTRLLQEDPALEQRGLPDLRRVPRAQPAGRSGAGAGLDARRQLGGAFRVLVMSATLEGERVAQSARRCRAGPGARARICSHGAVPRPRAAATARRPGRRRRRAAARTSSGCARCSVRWRKPGGDVLVISAGRGGDPARGSRLAAQVAAGVVLVLSLYGQMAAAAQDAVLAPSAAGHAQGRAGHQHRRNQPDHSRRHRGGGLRSGRDARALIRSRA